MLRKLESHQDLGAKKTRAIDTQCMLEISIHTYTMCVYVCMPRVYVFVCRLYVYKSVYMETNHQLLCKLESRQELGAKKTHAIDTQCMLEISIHTYKNNVCVCMPRVYVFVCRLYVYT